MFGAVFSGFPWAAISIGPVELMVVLMALVLGAGALATLVVVVLFLTNRRRPGRPPLEKRDD